MKKFITENQALIDLADREVSIIRTGHTYMYVTDADAKAIKEIAEKAGIDDYSICMYEPNGVMCSFYLYREEDRYHGNVWVEYRAIARDEDQVRALAEAAGYDIEGMVIEVDQYDAKDQLGYSYPARIWAQ